MSTVFRVNKTENYTVMSNYHMRDNRLSYKAIGILSKMLSLPPDWDYTLIGLAVISKDGKDSVRAGIKELEKYGYLKRRQLRDKNGRMINNEYSVYERPEDNPDYISESTENKGKSPLTENPTTVNSTAEKPLTENPTTVNPTTENPMTENPTQINTNIINTKELNTQSYQSKVSELTDTSDEIDLIDSYRSLIRDNISYDALKTQYGKSEADRIDEIVEIMAECICTKKKTVRIGGEAKSRELVKSRLMKINSDHIEYILACLKDNPSDVKNIKSYLLTTIYNAPATIGNYYAAKVNHDLYG